MPRAILSTSSDWLIFQSCAISLNFFIPVEVYAIRTEPQAYSTQAIQEVRIQQLEQEIAVLKQRNADLTMCL